MRWIARLARKVVDPHFLARVLVRVDIALVHDRVEALEIGVNGELLQAARAPAPAASPPRSPAATSAPATSPLARESRSNAARRPWKRTSRCCRPARPSPSRRRPSRRTSGACAAGLRRGRSSSRRTSSSEPSAQRLKNERLPVGYTSAHPAVSIFADELARLRVDHGERLRRVEVVDEQEAVVVGQLRVRHARHVGAALRRARRSPRSASACAGRKE